MYFNSLVFTTIIWAGFIIISVLQTRTWKQIIDDLPKITQLVVEPGLKPMWANTWICALDQQTVVLWKCKVKGMAWKPDQLAHSVNLLKPHFSHLLNEDLNSFCLIGSLWLFKEINAKCTVAWYMESSQYQNQLKKCEPGRKFGLLLSSTVKGERI